MKHSPMSLAFEEAVKAAARGEVPVGAVITYKGEVIARAGNDVISANDPCGHAEILAIQKACAALNNERLTDCELYVTLEPCTMCAGAISHARLKRVYYGAEDKKAGAIDNGVRFFTSPSCHHAPEVYSGFLEKESAQLLTDFFKIKR
jgi:tRNA(adenine34) deaminase